MRDLLAGNVIKGETLFFEIINLNVFLGKRRGSWYDQPGIIPFLYALCRHSNPVRSIDDTLLQISARTWSRLVQSFCGYSRPS